MRKVQKELIAQNYLVPGIQDVEGSKAHAPDNLEVRYFDHDSEPAAKGIHKIVTDNGAKDGGVNYEPPTPNDLKISPDIKTHLEVWAGKNSF